MAKGQSKKPEQEVPPPGDKRSTNRKEASGMVGGRGAKRLAEKKGAKEQNLVPEMIAHK